MHTWDDKTIRRYEALGRSTKKEFQEGVKIMERFIGRKKVFLPKLILIDDKGDYIETTNRTKLPKIEKMRKAEMLDYELFKKNMPLTNPMSNIKQIEAEFKNSKFYR